MTVGAVIAEGDGLPVIVGAVVVGATPEGTEPVIETP